MNANHFIIPGSVIGTIEYRRSASRCLWYSCNWIHTPTRLEFLTYCIQNCFLVQLDNRSVVAGSWNDVFKVSVVLYLIGTLVWNIFSTGEKILD